MAGVIKDVVHRGWTPLAVTRDLARAVASRNEVRAGDHFVGAAGPPHLSELVDATPRMQELYQGLLEGRSPFPGDPSRYVCLIARGWLARFYPGYFQPVHAVLRKLGMQSREIPLDTRRSSANQVDVVRETVVKARRSGKEVILLGHSLGANNVLDAVCRYPEVARHTAALVLEQGPLWGTPLLKGLPGPLLAGLDGTLQKLVHADPEALRELSEERRRAVLAEYPLPRGVRTVCLGSSSFHPGALTAPGSMYLGAIHGVRSDGVVPTQNAFLRGAKAVRLPNVDHATPAFPSWVSPSSYRPGELSAALIGLALEG